MRTQSISKSALASSIGACVPKLSKVLVLPVAALALAACGGSADKAGMALQVSKVSAAKPGQDPESAIFGAINAYRSASGLARQSRHRGLDAMARGQAAKMARKGKLEHSNIEYSEELAKRRHRLFNVEENILRARRLNSAQLAAVAIEGWVQSRGHRINLETQNSEVGIGVVEDSNGVFYAVAVTASPILREVESGRFAGSYGEREGAFQGVGW